MLSEDRILEESSYIMRKFSDRTGIDSDKKPVRYLWTDAFAVCNFLRLGEITGDDHYFKSAKKLINQVHEILGRHREDDERSGWISGLGEEEGKNHPTIGGLRIGKPLPERKSDEPFDDRMEWERDGQYFHYLTKWMHALDLFARRTKEPRYALWSAELQKTAAEAFICQGPAGEPRMYWKMSIDLSRPLVPSMGQHDPLDGYITTQQISETVSRFSGNEYKDLNEMATALEDVRKTYKKMLMRINLLTIDPLGLGGLLMDAAVLGQLIMRGASKDTELFSKLLYGAENGLRHWKLTGMLSRPSYERLGFRELGLAIGLAGVEWMRKNFGPDANSFRNMENPHIQLDALGEFLSEKDRIVSFWREPNHREGPLWKEHEDINDVMLATAMLPEGAIRLPS